MAQRCRCLLHVSIRKRSSYAWKRPWKDQKRECGCAIYWGVSD